MDLPAVRLRDQLRALHGPPGSAAPRPAAWCWPASRWRCCCGGCCRRDGPSTRAADRASPPGSRNGVYERYGQLLKARPAHGTCPGCDVGCEHSEGSRTTSSGWHRAGRLHHRRRRRRGHATTRAAGRGPAARPAPGCTTTTCSWSCRATPRSGRSADLQGMRVGVGQAGSGVQLVSRPAADGGRASTSTRTSRPVPVGIDTAPTMLQRRPAGRLLLVRRAADRRGAASSPERFAIRLVPLGRPRRASCTRRAAPRRYYRAGDDARRRLPAGAERAGRADHRGGQSAGHHATDVDAGLTERLTRTVINSRDRDRHARCTRPSWWTCARRSTPIRCRCTRAPGATTGRSSRSGGRRAPGTGVGAGGRRTRRRRRPPGPPAPAQRRHRGRARHRHRHPQAVRLVRRVARWSRRPPASRAREMDRPRPEPLTFWWRPLRQKRSPIRASSSSVRPGPPSATTTVDAVAVGPRP